MTYNVDYFIKKFEAIPEEKWCTATLSRDGASCALGHCNVVNYDMTDEANALEALLWEAFPEIAKQHKMSCIGEFTYSINDDHINPFRQPTPKQRVLAALYDIKKLNQGTEPSTERRNEVQSELPYVDQTKSFTQLIKVVEETSDCEIKIISD